MLAARRTSSTEDAKALAITSAEKPSTTRSRVIALTVSVLAFAGVAALVSAYVTHSQASTSPTITALRALETSPAIRFTAKTFGSFAQTTDFVSVAIPKRDRDTGELNSDAILSFKQNDTELHQYVVQDQKVSFKMTNIKTNEIFHFGCVKDKHMPPIHLLGASLLDSQPLSDEEIKDYVGCPPGDHVYHMQWSDQDYFYCISTASGNQRVTEVQGRNILIKIEYLSENEKKEFETQIAAESMAVDCPRINLTDVTKHAKGRSLASGHSRDRGLKEVRASGAYAEYRRRRNLLQKVLKEEDHHQRRLQETTVSYLPPDLQALPNNDLTVSTDIFCPDGIGLFDYASAIDSQSARLPATRRHLSAEEAATTQMPYKVRCVLIHGQGYQTTFDDEDVEMVWATWDSLDNIWGTATSTGTRPCYCILVIPIQINTLRNSWGNAIIGKGLCEQLLFVTAVASRLPANIQAQEYAKYTNGVSYSYLLREPANAPDNIPGYYSTPFAKNPVLTGYWRRFYKSFRESLGYTSDPTHIPIITLDYAVFITHGSAGLMLGNALTYGGCRMGSHAKWVAVQAPVEGTKWAENQIDKCNQNVNDTSATTFGSNPAYGSALGFYKNTLAVCKKPEDNPTKECIGLSLPSGTKASAELTAQYAVAKAMYANVDAALCGTSPSGMATSASPIMASLGTTQGCTAGDGIVCQSSCQAGLDASKFGTGAAGGNLVNMAISHSDGRLANGESTFDITQQPLRWIQTGVHMNTTKVYPTYFEAETITRVAGKVTHERCPSRVVRKTDTYAALFQKHCGITNGVCKTDGGAPSAAKGGDLCPAISDVVGTNNGAHINICCTPGN